MVLIILSPPKAQENEVELKAYLSFKDIAAKAGVGWIGKNDLLVTKRFGPRIRLGATILDADLPISISVTTSLCPNECTLCITACPYKLLFGNQWSIGATRTEMIDYLECNLQRKKFIKKHNRKNACGLCLAACPIGLSN
jgi:epoxyqueuosine reductase QueG